MSYPKVSDELANELLSLLKHRQLIPFYHPIVSLADRQIIGYESLLHGPTTSHLHLPFILFYTAAEMGLQFELEQQYWESSIQQFQSLKLEGKLFLNVSWSSVLQPSFQAQSLLEWLTHYKLSPDKLVLEMGEPYRPEQLPAISNLIYSYRLLGCQIAIDDLGAGHSDLRLWAELRPNYVKLDKYFLQNLPRDLSKKEFIRSLRDIALRLNCQLIAKGVGQETDYREIANLGIRLGQGHYFAAPQSNPPKQLPTELFLDATPSAYQYSLQRSNTIACLIVDVPVVRPTDLIETVADLFQAHPDVYSIPVVNNMHAAIGMVRRHNFMHLFLTRYGRELHGRKPINTVMDTDLLIFDMNLSLEEVSRTLTSNKLMPEYDFIIGEQGRYRGVGKVMDLLSKITDLQIRNARYANPLTLLPGNVPIYEYIDNLLQQHLSFVVGYCDLDNFKPFNDVYGYDKGDLVIQTVAKNLVAHSEPQQDFVGHVGGDDFIVVMRSSDWHERFTAILTDFELQAAAFYNDTDRQNQGIRTLDRVGRETFFPLLSLSIGVVVPNLEKCYSYHDIAAMATTAKHQAKKQVGNSLFVDRRQCPNQSCH